MSDRPVVVLGAGGHAKVIIATLQAAGRQIDCILDDNRQLQDTEVLGIPVIGRMDHIRDFRDREAIIAVGDNRVRREIADRLEFNWTVALHPSASIHPDAIIEPGTVVFAGAIVQPGCRIGAHCIINTAASVDHDCIVGSYVHIGPAVHLAGSVWVGEGAFLGIASVVLPNCLVGEWAVIGGGAVAVRDVRPRSVAIGVPAKPTRVRNLALELGKPLNSVARTDQIQALFIGPDDPRWTSILRRSRHDFYHLPAYVALAGKHDGCQPLAFYAEDGEGACLIPLLRRTLPQRLEDHAGWCDLVSPYGYPAPIFTESGDTANRERFTSAFIGAANELGACSVFLRLHPLLDSGFQMSGVLGVCLTQGETAVVDLDRSGEEIWQQTRASHQYDIRRLERLNFRDAVDDWSLFERFIEIYRETMCRIGAERHYLFDTEYFYDLKRALGKDLHLCCVLSPEGQLAAGGLFTAVGEIVQYHLSGSNSDFQKLAPTKLMLHVMRLWAKEHGYRFLHLGGGLGAERDALFQFKAGFSNSTRAFQTCRIIINERRYGVLALRAGVTLNPTQDLQAEYFPSYRAPGITMG